MSYFANVDEGGKVIRVIVIEQSVLETHPDLWPGRWVETRLDGSLRGKYAGIGFVYSTGADRFDPPPPRLPVASSHLVMLGDSIIQQMTPAQAGLPAPFRSAGNLGISGETVAQIAARAGSIPATAQNVIIEGGVNDMLGLAPVEGIAPGYRAILRAIPASMYVIVVGVLPVDEAALRADWRPYLSNAKIAAVNAEIGRVCAGFPNCRTAFAPIDVRGKTVDGLHLKQSTYPELAAVLYPLLR